MRRPSLPRCPDRLDHDGGAGHCHHPVPGPGGWWLLCCVCGCSESLRLDQPARKHGPHLPTEAA